jgi:hypothetical protein
MNIADRVKAYLTNGEDQPYCDDCLAEELELKRREQAQRVTMAIAGTGHFLRSKGPCLKCGNEKLVTRFSK